jgi:hypothetical protein
MNAGGISADETLIAILATFLYVQKKFIKLASTHLKM